MAKKGQDPCILDGRHTHCHASHIYSLFLQAISLASTYNFLHTVRFFSDEELIRWGWDEDIW